MLQKQYTTLITDAVLSVATVEPWNDRVQSLSLNTLISLCSSKAGNTTNPGVPRTDLSLELLLQA